MGSVKRFLRNVSGGTAVIYAIAAVPLLLGAGAAIDMVRINQTQTVLQSAADAAALAGASSRQTDQGDLDALVRDYLVANKVESVLSNVSSITQELDTKNRTFKVQINGKLDTDFMFLAGISSVDIGAKSEVNIGGNALEVALVLDNTASMNSEGRLDALKAAAKDLVREVLAAKDTGAYVKVGIVPFSDYVNVGLANRDQSWIDVPADTSTTQNVCNTTYPNATSSNCHQQTGVWNNDGVPTPYTYEVCDWAYGDPVTTCADQTWMNSWHGCVGSRNATLDAKITNLGTRYPGLQNTWCPQEITLFEDDKTLLESRINAMSGSGNTYIPAGILWGWNLLDSNKPLGSAKSEGWMEANAGSKAMVIMTDGDNTLSADYPYHWGNNVSAANAKTAELCNNVKNAGIVVYTVAFMVGNTVSKDMLRDCASDPANAFSADDSAGLMSAFQDIAKSLVAMRLTK